MKNLVTGGAGFLGSHLIDSLMHDHEQVICIDDLSTGDEKNIKKWTDNPNFEFILHDVINPIELKVDRIWHLACPASSVQYQKNPIKTSETNFLGTLNMLKIARKLNIEILFTSTSEIYGEANCDEQEESFKGFINPIGLRSCYGEGKRIAESLCFDFMRSYGTKIRIARLFNTYGPKMKKDDGRVICNLIQQAITKKSLTIYGNGKQSRCFCYVDDIIDGMKKLMISDYNYPVNLGNPNENFKILELVNLIRSKFTYELDLVFLPLPYDDPPKRKPSIELAKNLLNWEPKIDLIDGIDNTIKYIKNDLR